MKVNTIKKVAVSTMALAMGAALVGSISGSIAWYQYSTRSTVSYSGASAHCTESLQVRLYEDAIEGLAPTVSATIGSGVLLEDGVEYYHKVAEAGENGKLHDADYKYVKVIGDGVATSDGDYVTLSDLGRDAVAAKGDATWKSDLRAADVQAYFTAIGRANSSLRPVTSGVMAANSVPSTFYKNPIYQYEDKEDWGTASKTADFVDLPLQFRVVDVNGERTLGGDYTTFLAKNVYISRLDMAAIDNGKSDISDALRVGFDNGVSGATFSKDGADVNIFGQLDLNNDGIIDLKEAHEFDLEGIVANEAALPAADEHNGEYYGRRDTGLVYGSDGSDWTEVADDWYCSYGGASGVAASYDAADDVANDAAPNDIVANHGLLGQTNSDGSALRVTVRIYLEGWQELAGSAMWSDANYVGSAFKVNMRFSVPTHLDNE